MHIKIAKCRHGHTFLCRHCFRSNWPALRVPVWLVSPVKNTFLQNLYPKFYHSYYWWKGPCLLNSSNFLKTTLFLIWHSIRIFTLVHLGVVYFVHNTPIWVPEHFLDYLWGRLGRTNPPKEFLIQMDSKDYLLHHMIPLSHHCINCCDCLDIWNLLKNWLDASDRIPQRFRSLQAK